ncbi:hypothetical protein [Leptolyngbya sp. 'hensonii']|uniref:hypothetical protein n=1 Tax=Leptolyngbya sp. 'hensonii' TaxID=1922337 RepID=UPI00117FCD07|nr:hypothetical protein [Leptolyngbya sp. 'hensonii']
MNRTVFHKWVSGEEEHIPQEGKAVTPEVVIPSVWAKSRLTNAAALFPSVELQSLTATVESFTFPSISFVSADKTFSKDSAWNGIAGNQQVVSSIAPLTGLLSQAPDPDATRDASQQPATPSNLTASPGDPELGNLRLQQIAPPSKAPPVFYLLGRINYFRSDNIFSAIDPIGDHLVRMGLSLYLVPKLGPSTYLVASVNGNLIRYLQEPEVSYNEFQITAGFYQQITPSMYTQLGWSNQQLYSAETGEQFLNDHTVQLDLGRVDKLADQLTLSMNYQLRFSFTSPTERNRLVNYISASLAYEIFPALQAAIDYQIVISSFTQQTREDTYNQLVGRLTYLLTPETRLSLVGGISFGNSSNPNIKFNSSVVSINVDFSLPLF